MTEFVVVVTFGVPTPRATITAQYPLDGRYLSQVDVQNEMEYGATVSFYDGDPAHLP